MYNTFYILLFMFLSIAIALMCFSIFTKNQEKFIHYWGMSWVFYSISLVLLILYLNTHKDWLLIVRSIFDLVNILLLLFGSYAFMHIPIPNYWIKFSLYLIIWVVIGFLYGLDHHVMALPISISIVILCISLCIIICKYWNVERLEKILTITIFLLWGISKSLFSFIGVRFQDPTLLKMLEIILANIMSFSIILIYLQKIKRELAQREKQFRIIAENVIDIIFYYKLNPFPSFSYISPSVEKITGYSPQEFYSNPKLHIEIAHVDDQNTIQSLFSPKNKTTTHTIRWYSKDGNMIWVEFHNSMIAENSDITAIEGIILDITGRKKAEDELIQSKKSRQLLFSYISHELRTPITSILGYMSAIKDGTFDSQDKISNAIDLIISKVITLQRLINDLFQLSQLETKQFSFNFKQISALELFSHIIEKYSFDIRNAGLKLSTNITKNTMSKTSCDIIADPERLEQAFSNILINAIKYTNKHGKITILYKCDITSKTIILSISDTGTGIPEKDVHKIFDRFYQSESSERIHLKGGRGIGLTIAKEIIEAHGGKISVKSKVNIGSTFYISLPIYFDIEN